MLQQWQTGLVLSCVVDPNATLQNLGNNPALYGALPSTWNLTSLLWLNVINTNVTACQGIETDAATGVCLPDWLTTTGNENSTTKSGAIQDGSSSIMCPTVYLRSFQVSGFVHPLQQIMPGYACRLSSAWQASCLGSIAARIHSHPTHLTVGLVVPVTGCSIKHRGCRRS